MLAVFYNENCALFRLCHVSCIITFLCKPATEFAQALFLCYGENVLSKEHLKRLYLIIFIVSGASVDLIFCFTMITI